MRTATLRRDRQDREDAPEEHEERVARRVRDAEVYAAAMYSLVSHIAVDGASVSEVEHEDDERRRSPAARYDGR